MANMTKIELPCPHCKKQVRIAASRDGESIRCLHCFEARNGALILLAVLTGFLFLSIAAASYFIQEGGVALGFGCGALPFLFLLGVTIRTLMSGVTIEPEECEDCGAATFQLQLRGGNVPEVPVCKECYHRWLRSIPLRDD